MINWLAIKKAADIEQPSEGFIDNNRKMNPVPVDPMQQIRRQTAEEKAIKVPIAYAKGVARDMSDPQAWKDAIESVGTQWTRAWYGKVPMAKMLYKGPISMAGKTMANIGEKAGWMTPQQAEQQRKTWDWWTRPDLEKIEEVRRRFPYAQRLENNPHYRPVGNFLEESIVGGAVGEAMGMAKTGLNKAKDFIKNTRAKQTLADKLQHVHDRSLDLSSVNGEFERQGLNPADFEYRGMAPEIEIVDPKQLKAKPNYSDITPYRTDVGNAPMVVVDPKNPEWHIQPERFVRRGIGHGSNHPTKLTEPGAKLWSVPSENPEDMLGFSMDRPLITGDYRYIQKYPSGNPIIRADRSSYHFKPTETVERELAEKGIPWVDQANVRGISGDVEVSKRLSNMLGYKDAPIKTNLKMNPGVRDPELIRELPLGTPLEKATDDIIDFMPNIAVKKPSYNYNDLAHSISSSPAWYVRKGKTTAFRGVPVLRPGKTNVSKAYESLTPLDKFIYQHRHKYGLPDMSGANGALTMPPQFNYIDPTPVDLINTPASKAVRIPGGMYKIDKENQQ